MTRVSVVVPAFNAESSVERALRSILTQTYAEIEVLVVDDGSTDRTRQLVESMGAGDSRVRLIVRENGGVSSARNAGMDAARGSHVTFLDADDWMEPTHVARLVARAAETSGDVVQSGFVVDLCDDAGHLTSSESRGPGRWGPEEGTDRDVVIDEEFLRSLGYCWNKLYDLDFLRRGGHRFDRSMAIYEDMAFNAAVVGGGATLVTVEAATVHYVQNPIYSLGKSTGPQALDAQWQALEAVQAMLLVRGVPDAEWRRVLTLQAVQSLRADVVQRSRQRGTWATTLRLGRAVRRSSGHRAMVRTVLRDGSWRQRVEAALIAAGEPAIVALLRTRHARW